MMYYKWKAALIFCRHLGLLQTVIYIYRKMIGTRLIPIQCPHLGGEIWIRASTSDFSVLVQMMEEMVDLNLERFPELIIDGGCNIGLSARYFNCQFPKARIIGFEPDSGNRDVAALNCRSFPAISLEQKGLWSKPCKIILKNPEALPWAYEFKEISMTSETGIPAVSLNEVLGMEQKGIRVLVKLDVEGAEKEILTINNKWISLVDWILVEIHGPIEEKLDQSITEYGFIKKRIGEKVLYTRSIE